MALNYSRPSGNPYGLLQSWLIPANRSSTAFTLLGKHQAEVTNLVNQINMKLLSLSI